MELSAYVSVLRRWSLTILTAAVVAGGAALLVASRVPPTYQAEAQILVGPINTDDSTLDAAQKLAQTYAGLVTTDTVLDLVIASMGLEISPEVLAETTTARADSVTRLLTIEVQAGSPDTAAAIANGFATALNELTTTGQVRPEGEIMLVNAAVADAIPVEPQIPLIVTLAGAAGLVAALAMVLLVDYFSNTINGREDLSKLSRAPFLGAIAITRRFRPTPAEPLVVEARPESPAALSYRLMGVKIKVGDPASGIRSLVVMGIEGREGSGEVAANLAAVLTRVGRSIRLVDANDQDREITRLFGIESPYGLGEIARGGDALLARMVHRRSPGMDVIPHVAGTDPRLIEQERVTEVLKRLQSGVDLVILNVPPIHRSASALLWAKSSDAAILVAQRDVTKRENVTFSVETLRLIGTGLLGTVLRSAARRGGYTDLPDPEDAKRTADYGSPERVNRSVAVVAAREQGRDAKPIPPGGVE